MSRHKIKNAGKEKLIPKIKGRIRSLWVSRLRNSRLYMYCYPSYWHYLLVRNDNSADKSNLYFAARPNQGAGVGHQIANWIAGYWFAKKFDLNFAHMPFSSEKWEAFLGFYQDEKNVDELKQSGYKVVRIQKFDENNEEECRRIEQIIASYAGKKVVLLAEQDQFYQEQFGVMTELQDKFYSAPARNNEKLIFDKNAFNIALHVRRGDIMEILNDDTTNVSMRYQENGYFLQALLTALDHLKEKTNIHIYLFSQGEITDFPEFEKIENLHFCLEMAAQESFLHMVFADALITSKSSFSYKPALLNRGIKFCPADFWHGYPDTEDWVLLDKQGKKLSF